MKTKLLLFLFLAGVILTISSCGKKGCTDSTAQNYCETCKRSDQSCTYQGKIVFWWDKSFHDSLIAQGVSTLKFNEIEVDLGNGGSIVTVGTANASDFWNVAPECNSTGAFTTETNSITQFNTPVFIYEIKTNTGKTVELYDQISFQRNTCVQKQLIWEGLQ